MSLVPRRVSPVVLVLALATAAAAGAAVRWAPFGPNGGDVAMVAVAPSAPGVLYAATSGGVFQSTDRGANWTALDRTIGRRDVRAVAVDPHDPDVVYAATASDNVYKTTDGGATWRFSGKGLSVPYVRALAIDPRHPEVILAAAVQAPVGLVSGGIFRSADGSATWRPASVSPASAVSFTGLAFDPADSRTVYAAAEYVYRSGDGGLHWERLPDAFLGIVDAGPALGQVLVDPRRPATVLGCNGNGALRSTDRGATWEAASAGQFCFELHAIVVDPTSSQTVYAVGLGLHQPCFLGFGLKSTDGGRTWNLLRGNLDFASTIAVDPRHPSTLYVLAGRVEKSLDGGASWSLAGGGLAGARPWSLAIDPTKPRTLYLGTDSGIFTSNDGAAHWRLTNAAIKDMGALLVDPNAPSTLYGRRRIIVSSWNLQYSLWRSADGGRTWATITPDGLDGRLSGALALDLQKPGTLFVSTAGAGLFQVTIDAKP
jgi:photosystem II stability/assembly factor-like uncharacterized protein